MVSSGIRLKSADDIARARVGVFDDDHPLAYTGGGVGSTRLQCGSSALAACPDPELRERRSNLRPSLDRLPKPSTIVCCLPAMRVRGSASVRRCSLARSHGTLRVDTPTVTCCPWSAPLV